MDIIFIFFVVWAVSAFVYLYSMEQRFIKAFDNLRSRLDVLKMQVDKSIKISADVSNNYDNLTQDVIKLMFGNGRGN